MDIIGEKAVAEPTMARATARASILSRLSTLLSKGKAVTNLYWFFREIPAIPVAQFFFLPLVQGRPLS